MTDRPPRPRSVTEWYDEAIATLENAKERVRVRNAPVDGGALLDAMQLSKQLVALQIEAPTS